MFVSIPLFLQLFKSPDLVYEAFSAQAKKNFCEIIKDSGYNPDIYSDLLSYNGGVIDPFEILKEAGYISFNPNDLKPPKIESDFNTFDFLFYLFDILIDGVHFFF